MLQGKTVNKFRYNMKYKSNYFMTNNALVNVYRQYALVHTQIWLKMHSQTHTTFHMH